MGLVTSDTLDVLSHAAVRARNSSVLLASCSDTAALQGLRDLAGRSVELTLSQVLSKSPSVITLSRRRSVQKQCQPYKYAMGQRLSSQIIRALQPWHEQPL